MKKILLHTCCAPCLTYSLNFFKGQGFEVVVYFYNPNIHPEEEYFKRLFELKRYRAFIKFPLIVGDYDKERWFKLVRGYENEPEGGKRCEICYKIRLEKTAQKALELGIDIYSTTLTISPYQNVKKIIEIGKKIALKYNIKFFETILRKKGGFQKSVLISKKFGIWRQNYCGCVFSKNKKFFK